MTIADNICTAIGIFIFSLALGLILGAKFVEKYSVYKSALVEQGVAEYYLDDNHKRQWRLKKDTNERQ